MPVIISEAIGLNAIIERKCWVVEGIFRVEMAGSEESRFIQVRIIVSRKRESSRYQKINEQRFSNKYRKHDQRSRDTWRHLINKVAGGVVFRGRGMSACHCQIPNMIKNAI